MKIWLRLCLVLWYLLLVPFDVIRVGELAKCGSHAESTVTESTADREQVTRGGHSMVGVEQPQ